MPIDTNFKFGHQVARTARADALLVGGAAPPDPRGFLAGFVNNAPLAAPNAPNPQSSWKGQGFNLIWRPNFDKSINPKDFFLELNVTQETLDFTDITASGGNIGIANRGSLQPDIRLGGIAYLQQVADAATSVGQHFEPGVWINIPNTTNPLGPASVTRMGSIPHGTTVNLEGVVFPVTTPFIADTTITPFQVGSPDDGVTGLVHFPDEETLANPTPARTLPSDVPTLTQDVLTNPNKLLQNVVAGQTIINTTVISVASDPALVLPPGGPVPDHVKQGGGIANIGFLSGGQATGFNANVAATSAIFWIETVQNTDGTTFQQLQYTQRVLLVFKGLVWPHVSVATLLLQPST